MSIEDVKERDVQMPVRCGDCGREWEEHFITPMNAREFVERTRAVRCPKCGGKDIYINGNRGEMRSGNIEEGAR